MKCIVGLGNPGKEYETTRHNVGCMVVDNFSENLSDQPRFSFQAKFSSQVLQQGDIVLVKPQTYMNLSGRAVAHVLNYFKLNPATDLLVIHDDLDIAFGDFKLQFATGPKMHNGMTSVEQHLGTKDFWRLRIGIDAPSRTPSEGIKIPGDQYVLMPFAQQEFNQLNQVISKTQDTLKTFIES